MYNFVSSMLQEKGYNKPFLAVNLNTVTMLELFNKYQDGYIVLGNLSLTGELFLDLNDLWQDDNTTFSNVNFTTWLSLQGRRALPVKTTKPVIIENEITYSEVIDSDYIIKRVSPSDINDVSDTPRHLKTDAYLTKPGVDKSLLSDYCITTVNGLFHLSVPRLNGLLIRGAGTSLDQVAYTSKIGIISFEKIGVVTQHAIRPEMLLETDTLRKGCYVDLKTSTSKKSLLVSLAGRLYSSDIIKPVNEDGLCKLDIGRLNLVDLLMSVDERLALDDLPLEQQVVDASAYSESDIDANDVVLKLLTLPQSFIIVVDTPYLVIDHVTLNHTYEPGLYIAPKQYFLPFLKDDGSLSEVNVRKYNEINYGYYVQDGFYKPALKNALTGNPDVVNYTVEPGAKDGLSIGRLFRIRSQFIPRP